MLPYYTTLFFAFQEGKHNILIIFQKFWNILFCILDFSQVMQGKFSINAFLLRTCVAPFSWHSQRGEHNILYHAEMKKSIYRLQMIGSKPNKKSSSIFAISTKKEKIPLEFIFFHSNEGTHRSLPQSNFRLRLQAIMPNLPPELWLLFRAHFVVFH